MSKADVSSGYGNGQMFILFENRDHFYSLFFLLGKGLEISVCAKLTEKEGSHHCESSYNSWVCFFGKFLGYFSLNGTAPSFCFGLIFSTSASFFSSYTRSIMLCLFFLVSICNQYFLWSLSPASAPPHMAKTCRFFTP